ncbi:putative kinetochore protein [Diaporthe ampelina]|uniref:Putative kinetochore protein n=1 Tax=Diaporthe ampelina TaxID=1214573 RepID=A0A0G2FA38_9PEZI|nr:putative kinetochore protein [Diaporthe ampelina]
MAPPAPTILTLKQNFITTQTRLLSQPLQPSRAWRRANDEDEAALSERAVDDALFRLNHTLQQHSRRAYVPQATRQIAEQVDKLYLSAGERRGVDDGDDGADGDEDEDDAWRNVGADYADAGVVSSLPPAWESERQAAAYPLEAERYAELAARLRGLVARRDEAKVRVGRLRRIKALLAPFGGIDGAGAGAGADEESLFGPSGGVQENLVTRGGEVEKELERMRMLLVRVGDKVARLKEREAGRDGDDSDLFGDGDAMIVDDVEVEERRKVDGLLDGLG